MTSFELRGGCDLVEHRYPLGVWAIDQQLAIESENIEQVEPHRLLGAEFFNLAHAAEPAHQLLERSRTSIVIDRDNFAVEDRRA